MSVRNVVDDDKAVTDDSARVTWGRMEAAVVLERARPGEACAGLRSEKQWCECKARFTVSAKALGSDWTWGMEEDKVLGGPGRSVRGEDGSSQPPASAVFKNKRSGF